MVQEVFLRTTREPSGSMAIKIVFLSSNDMVMIRIVSCQYYDPVSRQQ